MSHSHPDQSSSSSPCFSSMHEPAWKKQKVESSTDSSAAVDSSAASVPMELDSTDSTATMRNPTTRGKAFPLLYTDVVHCILRFVDDLVELRILTQLSHFFNEAVRSLRPTFNQENIVLAKPKRKRLIPYHSSALAPHVSEVIIFDWDSLHPRVQLMHLAPFTSLKIITGMNVSKFPTMCKLSLPPTLTSISICTDERSLKSVINAVSRIVRMKKLIVAVIKSDQVKQTPTFAPLRQLVELESLDLHYSGVTTNSVDADSHLIGFLKTVRQMPSLRSLDFGEASKCALTILTHKSNKLHLLKEIHTLDRCDEPYLQLLSHLPGLTELNHFFKGISSVDISPLLLLTNLTGLSLRFKEDDIIPPVSNIISSICHLQLIQFRLSHPTINTSQLTEILSHFPLLEELSLFELNSVDSLSSLEIGPVTQSLTTLSIIGCLALSTSELFKLRSLTRLNRLDIFCAFDQELCDCAKQLFTPGSPNLIIPTITHFTYQSEISDSSDELEYDSDYDSVLDEDDVAEW